MSISSKPRQNDDPKIQPVWNEIFEALDHQVLVLAPDFTILTANHLSILNSGRAGEELIGRKCYEVYHGSDGPPANCPVLALFDSNHRETGVVDFESLDKSMLVTGKPVFDEEGRLSHVIHIAMDISRQRRVPSRQKDDSGRILEILRTVTRLITREKDGNMLLRSACRILTGPGGYDHVWFGLVPKGENRVTAIASCSADGTASEPAFIPMDTSVSGLGPASVAVKTGKAVILNDIAREQRDGPWKEEVLREGFQCCAAVPLIIDNRLIGTMSVFSGESAFLDNGELELLHVMAAEIAYALHTLDIDEQRRQAEDRLQKALSKMEQRVEARTADLLALNDAMNQEIVERKRAEETSRKQYEFLHNIIESITHPLYVINADDYRIVLANSETAAKSEWIGSTCHALTHKRPEPCNDEAHGCPLAIVKKTGKPAVVEHTHYNRHGRKLCFEVYGYPIFDGEGNVKQMIEYCVDITERKRLEKEVLKAKTLEATAVLAGGIAHDFNNLLTAIIGNISLARQRLPGTEPVYRYLVNAEKAGKQAARLTRKFITFSKGGHPMRDTCSLPLLLQNVADYATRNSRHSYELNCPDALWEVWIDRDLIHHALMNIVVNAMEAQPAGGVIRIACANVEPDSPAAPPHSPDDGSGKKRYVKVDISDEGSGIPEEHLQQVFDPYFTTKEMSCKKGLGMGLTTTYSIIKKHNGLITIDTKSGRGTTVTVFLPVILKNETTASSAHPTSSERTCFTCGHVDPAER